MAPDIKRYVESYAEHFNLLQRIEFSTAVEKVERDEGNNRWIVFTRNTKTGSENKRSFSRVVVATGQLNVKNMPGIKGMDKFAGEAMHSRHFNDMSRYKGKNVLADFSSYLVKAGHVQWSTEHAGQRVSLASISSVLCGA